LPISQHPFTTSTHPRNHHGRQFQKSYVGHRRSIRRAKIGVQCARQEWRVSRDITTYPPSHPTNLVVAKLLVRSNAPPSVRTTFSFPRRFPLYISVTLAVISLWLRFYLARWSSRALFVRLVSSGRVSSVSNRDSLYYSTTLLSQVICISYNTTLCFSPCHRASSSSTSLIPRRPEPFTPITPRHSCPFCSCITKVLFPGRIFLPVLLSHSPFVFLAIYILLFPPILTISPGPLSCRLSSSYHMLGLFQPVCSPVSPPLALCVNHAHPTFLPPSLSFLTLPLLSSPSSSLTTTGSFL